MVLHGRLLAALLLLLGSSNAKRGTEVAGISRDVESRAVISQSSVEPVTSLREEQLAQDEKSRGSTHIGDEPLTSLLEEQLAQDQGSREVKTQSGVEPVTSFFEQKEAQETATDKSTESDSAMENNGTTGQWEVVAKDYTCKGKRWNLQNSNVADLDACIKLVNHPTKKAHKCGNAGWFGNGKCRCIQAGNANGSANACTPDMQSPSSEAKYTLFMRGNELAKWKKDKSEESGNVRRPTNLSYGTKSPLGASSSVRSSSRVYERQLPRRAAESTSGEVRRTTYLPSDEKSPPGSSSPVGSAAVGSSQDKAKGRFRALGRKVRRLFRKKKKSTKAEF